MKVVTVIVILIVIVVIYWSSNEDFTLTRRARIRVIKPRAVRISGASIGASGAVRGGGASGGYKRYYTPSIYGSRSNLPGFSLGHAYNPTARNTAGGTGGWVSGTGIIHQGATGTGGGSRTGGLPGSSIAPLQQAYRNIFTPYPQGQRSGQQQRQRHLYGPSGTPGQGQGLGLTGWPYRRP